MAHLVSSVCPFLSLQRIPERDKVLKREHDSNAGKGAAVHQEVDQKCDCTNRLNHVEEVLGAERDGLWQKGTTVFGPNPVHAH